jgi:DNA replication factor GINS
MQLEELRLIVLNERESGKLSEIPRDIFENAQKYLTGLHRDAYREAQAMDGFLPDRARDMLEEINSVKETLQDIVRLRSRKILMLALLQTESQYMDKEEIRKMLPSEKVMLEGLTEALQSCRRSLLEYGAAGEEPVPPAGVAMEDGGKSLPLPEMPPVVLPDEKSEDAEILLQKDEGDTSVALVRVLGEIEPFMGVDGRIYNLGKEDLVTIPQKNAEVLCERNIALNIRLSK